MGELFRIIGEFFHGWRQKAGIASLAVALTFAGCWVRSMCVTDYLLMTSGTGPILAEWTSTGAWSSRGGLYWKRFGFGLMNYNQEPANEWGCKLNSEEETYVGDYPVSLSVTDANVEWSWRLFGCGVGTPRMSNSMPAKKAAVVVISYWAMVAPFTAMAAILLLARPRRLNDNRQGSP